MKRITITRGLLCLAAVAALAAQPNAGNPRYVAVELNLDGAVRDAGAASHSGQVDNRRTATGQTHAVVRRGDNVIDLHPAEAVSSWAVAGNTEMQVGSAAFGSHNHAMVWRSESGSGVDLHAFLPSTYTDSMATGMDDAGNVTGVAIASDGTAHDMLWRSTRGGVTTLSSGGGGGGNAGGGGGGGVASTDKVSITRALWFWDAMAPPTGWILVQATSSNPSAVLVMSDAITGRLIATLPNIGGGRYGGSVIFQFDRVDAVTVTSSLGGTASRKLIIGVQ